MIRGWYEFSLSSIFLFVVAGAFISGIWGGLLSATWATVYTFYVMPPTSRLIQLVISTYAVALLVGYGTYKLKQAIEAKYRMEREAEQNRLKSEMINSADSILRVFGETFDITGSLRLGWENIPDETRFHMLKLAHENLASLITLGRGFEQMVKNERLAKAGKE